MKNLKVLTMHRGLYRQIQQKTGHAPVLWRRPYISTEILQKNYAQTQAFNSSPFPFIFLRNEHYVIVQQMVMTRPLFSGVPSKYYIHKQDSSHFVLLYYVFQVISKLHNVQVPLTQHPSPVSHKHTNPYRSRHKYTTHSALQMHRIYSY